MSRTNITIIDHKTLPQWPLNKHVSVFADTLIPVPRLTLRMWALLMGPAEAKHSGTVKYLIKNSCCALDLWNTSIINPIKKRGWKRKIWWEDEVKMRLHGLGRCELWRQRTKSAEFFLSSLYALSTHTWPKVFIVGSNLSPLAWMCAYPAATGLGYSSTGLVPMYVHANSALHRRAFSHCDIQLTYMEISIF